MTDERRLVLVGPGPGTRGGIAQFNVELARVLEAAGARPHLIEYRRIYPRFSRAGRQGSDPSSRPDGPPVSTILVPWLPWTWSRANRHIRKLDPHTLVLQHWHPITALSSWYIARSARRRGIRTVFVCHNAVPHEPFPLGNRLTALALRQATEVLALSQGVADEVRALIGSDARVIPHPSYSALAASADSSPERVDEWRRSLELGDSKVVLFFGNVRPYKGLADLVDAFAYVHGELSATLVVAGTFFESEGLYREQIEELGLSASVRLVPRYIANEDVAAIFSLADLVVLPYRSASQSGVLPLAAMFGKPVVATAVGGLPEALGTNGKLVPPGDPPALGQAIAECLRTPPAPPDEPRDAWPRWKEAILSD